MSYTRKRDATLFKEKLSAKHINILAEYGLSAIKLFDASILKYESGEFILQQGCPISYLMIFLEGKAKVVFTSPNGRTLLISFYTKRGIIGEAEFMAEKEVATSGVQAITDVSCIGIPLNRHKEYLRSNLKLMNYISLELADKLYKSTIRSTLNILHSLDARLCSYIEMTNVEGFFKEKMTDVSEILGTSYRHLLRTLEKLCDEGVLEKIPRGYYVKDALVLRQRGADYYLR